MQSLELENLHQKLVKSAGDYHVSQARILDHLQDAERVKRHLYRGFPSMFDYVTKEIGLSESCAQNFINVARKALEVRELKEGVRRGDFGISKARKVTSVLKRCNQKEWLDDLKNKSTCEIERKVASNTDNPKPRESLKPIAKNTAKLTLDIDDELVEMLNQLKDLTASRVQGACTTQVAIKLAVKEFIKRHDPVKKAERAKKRGWKCDDTEKSRHTQPISEVPPPNPRQENPKKCGTVHVNGKSKRKRGSIPASVLHKVYERDGGQCVYQGKSGVRCRKKRYIHLHHQIPVAQGGKHHPDNLITLCSSHHRFLHEGGRLAKLEGAAE
jgi:hypothetical protein